MIMYQTKAPIAVIILVAWQQFNLSFCGLIGMKFEYVGTITGIVPAANYEIFKLSKFRCAIRCLSDVKCAGFALTSPNQCVLQINDKRLTTSTWDVYYKRTPSGKHFFLLLITTILIGNVSRLLISICQSIHFLACRIFLKVNCLSVYVKIMLCNTQFIFKLELENKKEYVVI